MTTVPCDPCRVRSRSILAEYWCSFCHEAFCKSCCQFHQTMKLTRSHQVKTIADVLPSDREQGGMRSYDFETTLNPEAMNEQSQLREIDHILVTMDGLSDTALTLKQMFFDLKMRNESERVDCMRKVNQFRDKLKRLADDFEKHIASELDNLQQTENHQIQSYIEECESLFHAIEMSKDLTQVMKTELFTPTTFRRVNVARHRCVEYKFALQKIHGQLHSVQYKLAIDRNISEALSSSPSLIGQVEVTYDDDPFIDADSLQSSTTTSPRTARSSSTTSLSTHHKADILDLKTTHAQKTQDILPQQNSAEAGPIITSICVLSNNHIITLDRSNSKLLLIYQDGGIVSQYVFTSTVWGMTLVDPLTVAVTLPDHDKIVLVRVRNRNLCAEKLIKTSNICYGICVIDGFIVVTTKGGFVKIVTKAGEEVASIRHNSRGDVLFVDPQHLATNRHSNELYVTDYSLHTVTALFLTGVSIDPEPKFVFCNNELRNPTGLCLDSAGNVYVCGYSTHNVLKLTGNGQLSLVVLSGVINPQSLALSTLEDQLYVSLLTSDAHNQTQNVISVFKI